MLKVKLADNAPIRAVVKAPLSDVKTGSFVGITAMPQPDGTQKAVEIHNLSRSHARDWRGPSPVGSHAQQYNDKCDGCERSRQQQRQDTRFEIQGRRKNV